MFKRDAGTEPELPLDLRALSDIELDGRIEDLKRRHVVQKNELYLGCVDRRCRRVRTCAAGGGRCVCADVPPMGKRERKRRRMPAAA